MRRSIPIFLTLVVLLCSAHSAYSQSVLLIASSNHNGSGPYTSTIQTPLVAAGYTVRVWASATEGWPPLDTLWAYNAVFFHASERRRTGTVDSTLTLFAEQGGRLVSEGCNIASDESAFIQLYKHVTHGHWEGSDHTAFTHHVVDAAHPIAAGLPASFNATNYPGGSVPEKVVPWYGGHLVIEYSNQPGTVAVVATPRTAFVSGSLYRIADAGARSQLITNLVSWVLTNPDDYGLIDIGYQLGTSVGQATDVWAKIRNFATSSRSGWVRLEQSTDSTTWSSVDSATYNLSSGGDDTLHFTWTPQNTVRYFLRAVALPGGADAYAENNSIGMRITTFHEAPHPHLYFTAAEIPTLQTWAATTHSDYVQHLTADVMADMSYVPRPPHQWNLEAIDQLARMLSCASLMAVLNPTPTYINNAKNKALALCRYPHWEAGITNQDIYSGRCCVALGLCYDWLYPYFTKAERDTIQVKLRTQLERFAAAWPHWVWWPDAYMHNHNINCGSYLGAAAFTLMVEEPEAAKWEQMAIDNLDNILELFGPVTDGSFYEAMNYWGFVSWTQMPHVWLLREQLGIDYFDTPWYRNMYLYRTYGSMPFPEVMPTINESQTVEWYGPDEQLGLFAREYNNTEAQWIRQQVINRAGYKLNGPIGFFFYDPTVGQTQPTDLSWVATDQEIYFGRSAWNDTMATYVTLKCGLPCGRHCYERFWGPLGRVGDWEPSHCHPDQNAFTLFFNGDYIVQASGLQEPKHRTYNSTTMLVNGQGQIGDSTKGAWPLPVDRFSMNPHLADTFMMPTVDYVVGDATTSYPIPLGLTRYHRHLLYIRPDMVLLLDDMKATAPATFTMLLRYPTMIHTWSPTKVTFTAWHGTSDMYMLEPDEHTFQYSYNNYYYENWGGWGLRVSNAVPDTAVRFVNVFYPREPDTSAVTLLYTDNKLTVARLASERGFEATCAITYGNIDTIDVDSLVTDASLAVIIRNDTLNTFRTGVIKQGSFLDWGTPARRLAETSIPSDLEWSLGSDTLTITGNFGNWGQFYAPDISVVVQNGLSIPFNQLGDYVEVGASIEPPGQVAHLRLYYNNSRYWFTWTPHTFTVHGTPTPPDFYDIFSSVYADSVYTLYQTVPGTDTTYSVATIPDSIRFFQVIARLGESQPMLQLRKDHTPASRTIIPALKEESGPPRTK